MTLQVNLVNLGSYPNDGTGDDLRSAFVKSNQNFQSIAENVVLNAVNLGAGTPIFVDKVNNTLRFRSISSANANMAISYDSNGITLNVRDSIGRLEEDPNPTLNGTLILNGNNIEGFGNIDIIGNITAGTINGNFTGDFTGNISGDIVGTLTGDVNGNVNGQVSDISNHTLEDLGNVSTTIPSIGQALVWNGSEWLPTNVLTTGGVTKIIAGDNVTVTPENGIGEVTINAVSDNLSFNNYDFGLLSGVRNAFDLVMQFTHVDFGPIYAPSSVNLDLGFIDQNASLYNLSSVSAVTEGDTFTISLTTVNVENGTLVPYTITGVSSDDIEGASLTGSFTVLDNFASISFTVSIDELVETETLTLTLNSITPTVAISVTLLDEDSEILDYSEGDIDGGGPTTSFTVVADGGVIDTLVDGGSSETEVFTQTIDGGSSSSIPIEVIDGGIVA
jgi:hypothetical protein